MRHTGQPKEVSSERFKELIRDQYHQLDETLDLAIEDIFRIVLLPQTVLGRAQKGHGLFQGVSRPNIQMPEILEALKFPVEDIRAGRQKMMEDFSDCIDDLINGKKKTLTDRSGRPLFGVEFLGERTLEVDKYFFQGGALVGRMDIPYWRKKTREANPRNLRKMPFKIGYGEELPISLNRMKDLKLTFSDLADKPHSLEDLALFREYGLLVTEEKLRFEGFTNTFIRYSCGKGVCDDASFISIGLMYGIDAMDLGFCVDAADTYTKFCENKVPGGFDEFIGKKIEMGWKEKYGEDLLTEKETTDLIFLGAKETIPLSLSSSHRRLVEREKTKETVVGGIQSYTRQSLPTYLNHQRFVTHGETPNFEMGFERVSSQKFYDNIQQRFTLTGRKKYLPRRSQ